MHYVVWPNPLEDGHLPPSLFVLLANKTEATYMKMLEQIQILCPDALPTHLMVDFEKAVFSRFQHFWPTTNIKDCFFHLTQNIWRKVQAEGMQAQYNIDEVFALRIRFIPSLAFDSPFDVRQYFETVVEHLPMPASQELILYFERTYIARRLPGGNHQYDLSN